MTVVNCMMIKLLGVSRVEVTLVWDVRLSKGDTFLYS